MIRPRSLLRLPLRACLDADAWRGRGPAAGGDPRGGGVDDYRHRAPAGRIDVTPGALAVRLDRRQFGGIAVLAAMGGGVALLRGERDDPATAARRAPTLTATTGVRIFYGAPTRFFVAPYGPADAAISQGHAEPAAAADVPPALDGIAASLGIYPPGFYARLCPAIFVCGTLVLDGARAGGTYGPRWIILAADPDAGAGGIRETARLGVHHEFSSLVLARVPAVVVRWAALLPAGWRAAPDTAAALAHANGEVDPASGFLSAYAMTSAENDFNTYAEVAFGDPTRLAALARQHSRVAVKAGLLLGTYAALDTRLAATFARLGLGAIPPASVDIRPVELRVAPRFTGTPSASRRRSG